MRAGGAEMSFQVGDSVFVLRSVTTGEIEDALANDAYDVFEDFRKVVSQHEEKNLGAIPPGRRRSKFRVQLDAHWAKAECWIMGDYRYCKIDYHLGGLGEPQRGGRYNKVREKYRIKRSLPPSQAKE